MNWQLLIHRFQDTSSFGKASKESKNSKNGCCFGRGRRYRFCHCGRHCLCHCRGCCGCRGRHCRHHHCCDRGYVCSLAHD